MKYYTVQEIMKRYQCCHTTVYKWFRKGWLTPKRTYEGPGVFKYLVSEDDIRHFDINRPYLYWSNSGLTQEIDIIARENLEILYGIREDINEEIRKYEDILSIIKTEETF